MELAKGRGREARVSGRVSRRRHHGGGLRGVHSRRGGFLHQRRQGAAEAGHQEPAPPGARPEGHQDVPLGRDVGGGHGAGRARRFTHGRRHRQGTGERGPARRRGRRRGPGGVLPLQARGDAADTGMGRGRDGGVRNCRDRVQRRGAGARGALRVQVPHRRLPRRRGGRRAGVLQAARHQGQGHESAGRQPQREESGRAGGHGLATPPAHVASGGRDRRRGRRARRGGLRGSTGWHILLTVRAGV